MIYHHMINRYVDIKNYDYERDETISYQEVVLIKCLKPIPKETKYIMSNEIGCHDTWMLGCKAHYFNLAIPLVPWLKCIKHKRNVVNYIRPHKIFVNELYSFPSWHEEYPYSVISKIEKEINEEFNRY